MESNLNLKAVAAAVQLRIMNASEEEILALRYHLKVIGLQEQLMTTAFYQDDSEGLLKAHRKLKYHSSKIKKILEKYNLGKYYRDLV